MKNVNAIFLGAAIIILGMIPLCKHLKSRNAAVDVANGGFGGTTEITTEVTTEVTTEENTTEETTEVAGVSSDVVSEEETDEGDADEYSGKKSLFDCQTLIGDWEEFCDYACEVKDNVGEYHDSYMIGSNYGDKITVILGKQYTTLDIPVIYLTDKTKDDGSEIHLVFYDQDGNKIGKTPNFKPGKKPDSCSINVEGVDDLIIEIKGKERGYNGIDWGWATIGIDEAWLY